MTTRTLAAALALTVLAPFAAHADAPSGEFFTVFANQPGSTQPAPSGRDENRLYVEFTIDELIRNSAGATVTVDEVRRALATMPTPPVGA